MEVLLMLVGYVEAVRFLELVVQACALLVGSMGVCLLLLGCVLDDKGGVLEGVKRPVVLYLDVRVGFFAGNQNAST